MTRVGRAPLEHRAEVEAQPVSPLRLPPRDAAGTTRGDGDGVARLVHLEGRPVVLRVAATADARLRLSAQATTAADASVGLERARFWSGVDDDLGPFLRRFADDPLIGDSVREAPWLRPYRRPLPFEALLGAICEQLITDERATEIRRAVNLRFGARHDGLLDAPGAATVASLAPAQLEACGLAAARARTLVKAAREVASGRVDLLDPERRDESWRRLRAVPGIGSWTLGCLALHGQGIHDALPAGDHAYAMAVMRLRGLRRKASEAEVLEHFAPYAGWRGVAGWHVLRTLRRRGALEPRGGGWPGARLSRRRVGPAGP